MKKLILLISVLLITSSINVQGQQDNNRKKRICISIDWWFKSNGHSKRYVSPPASETFTDFVTLTSPDTQVDGQIFPADLGGKKQVKLSGAWPFGAAPNTLVNDYGIGVKFQNLDGSTTIGTTSLNQAAMASTNGTTNIEISGKSPTEQFVMSAGTGQSGINWAANATVTNRGSILRVGPNVWVKDVGYAGILASDATAAREYKKLIVRHSLVDGLTGDGEGFYQGNVSSAIRTRLSIIAHSIFAHKGREGDQTKWGDDVKHFNVTCYDVGHYVSEDGQNHGIQVEASNGFYEGFIVDTAMRPFNVFTHGFTFKNGYIRFTGTQRGYIGNADDHFHGDPRLNGQPLVFDGYIFYYDNGAGGILDYLTGIDETDVTVEFKNSVFINISAITTGVHANLIGTTTTNGNTSITVPAGANQYKVTYLSTDRTSQDYLKITSDYHYNRGLGAKTPSIYDTRLAEAREQIDLGVAYNTAWASISLPITAEFLASDGYYYTLPVTWSQGSYSATTPGLVTVFGTPTLTGNLKNPYTVSVEKGIIVGDAPTADKHVLVDLTTSTSPVLTATGNWNHATYTSFATGSVTLKDGLNNTLPSLINTEGTSTGYGVSVTSGFSAEAIGETSSTGAVYPVAVNTSVWNQPGSSGNVRTFTFTSLNNSLTYTVKLLGSVDNGVGGGSHTCDLQVTGATSPSYQTGINVSGNVSTTTNFTVAPSAGVITVNVRRTSTGSCAVAAVELVYTP